MVPFGARGNFGPLARGPGICGNFPQIPVGIRVPLARALFWAGFPWLTLGPWLPLWFRVSFFPLFSFGLAGAFGVWRVGFLGLARRRLIFLPRFSLFFGPRSPKDLGPFGQSFLVPSPGGFPKGFSKGRWGPSQFSGAPRRALLGCYTGFLKGKAPFLFPGGVGLAQGFFFWALRWKNRGRFCPKKFCEI